MNGLVDFGLFVGNTDLEKYDYLKLPKGDRWGLLMRRDHPLAQAASVRPSDLAEVPLLCSRQALHSNELSGWLGYDFSKLNIVSTHNLVNNTALMVKAGMGCALTIDRLVNTQGTPLTFRPLEPAIEAALFFAWKKYQVFSRAGQKFLEVLGEVIGFPGKWSSYPPHHHPQPEIYYYKTLPANGFAYAELGEDVLKVHNNDTVLIAPGLTHPHCTPPGYALWYLWAIRHLPGERYGTPTFVPQHLWVQREDAVYWGD